VEVSVDVRTDTVVDRPVEIVAAHAADPSNAPEWYVNIESVEWDTSPPAQPGSRVSLLVLKEVGGSTRTTSG
jgi:hypothetical protein